MTIFDLLWWISIPFICRLALEISRDCQRREALEKARLLDNWLKMHSGLSPRHEMLRTRVDEVFVLISEAQKNYPNDVHLRWQFEHLQELSRVCRT